MFKKVKPGWKKFFVESKLDIQIEKIAEKAYSFENIFPKKENLLKLFEIIDIYDINVIVVGQDPYHNKEQADGIAFSISNEKAAFPPSLRNIFKELKNDLKINRNNKNLVGLVNQGLFLINTTWTVPTNQPNAHKDIGWRQIVIKILNYLLELNSNIICCLWGNFSKNLYNILDSKSNFVIQSTHPSPFSYKKGFENSKPFSKINEFLKLNKKKEIDWTK